MTLYVDPLRTYSSGRWCHLMADTVSGLVQAAEDLGLDPERALQADHIDLRPSMREKAIRLLGAQQVSSRTLVRLRRWHRERAVNGYGRCAWSGKDARRYRIRAEDLDPENRRDLALCPNHEYGWRVPVTGAGRFSVHRQASIPPPYWLVTSYDRRSRP